MIKFIATDLDGTLLDEHGALSEEIFPSARRLFERGILFAPASGRQYANLKKLFFPVWEKLLFICENGALVKRGGEIVYLNPIPVSLVKDALDATPPDLASDLMYYGILLTGGGALLRGLDVRLRDETGVSVNVSPTALDNVVNGCARVLEANAFDGGFVQTNA